MPTELRILILKYIPTLESLHNTVSASRAYHESYLAARKEILSSFVHRQYDLVDIAEAIAVVRSEGLNATEENKEEVIALLDRRRRPQEIRHSANNGSANEPESVEECCTLLRIHRELNRIVDNYSLRAPCPSWIQKSTWHSKHLPINLSVNERTRLLRGLYRLQTYCNIFGQNTISPHARKGSKIFSYHWWPFVFKESEMWGLFFATFPPWEVEEFTCIWIYMERRYSEFFEEISRDLENVPQDAMFLQFGGLKPHGTILQKKKKKTLRSFSLVCNDG